MITLIPIEPLDERHGALIVEAFGRFLIDGGGQPDGYGGGYGDGGGWGDGHGYGYGDGGGMGSEQALPDEWRVK